MNMKQLFTSIAVAALIALVTTFASGCGAAPPEKFTATAPDEFGLTLYTAEPATLKFTWFELKKNGELHYAGGRDASTRNGKLVATLTPEQRKALWDILVRGKLDDAKAGPLFPEGKRATYDFTLNTGGIDRIIRAADDEQPALREVHDFLFDIQKAQYAK